MLLSKANGFSFPVLPTQLHRTCQNHQSMSGLAEATKMPRSKSSSMDTSMSIGFHLHGKTFFFFFNSRFPHLYKILTSMKVLTNQISLIFSFYKVYNSSCVLLNVYRIHCQVYYFFFKIFFFLFLSRVDYSVSSLSWPCLILQLCVRSLPK